MAVNAFLEGARTSGQAKTTVHMQENILARIWRSGQMQRYIQLVPVGFFTTDILQIIWRKMLEYHDTYNATPTPDALYQLVMEHCQRYSKYMDMADQFIDTLADLETRELPAESFLDKLVLDFAKSQAYLKLTERVIDAAKDVGNLQVSTVPELEAWVGEVRDVEHALDDDVYIWNDGFHERMQKYATEPDVIIRYPTQIKELDEVLKGGLGEGEMGVVVAPPGVGKTTTMISMLGGAIRRGYDCAHFSFENDERQIIRNYDTRIMGKEEKWLVDPANAEQRDRAWHIMKSQADADKTGYCKPGGIGQLLVKRFAPNTVNIDSIRSCLDTWKSRFDFVPQVIAIDYPLLLLPRHHCGDRRLDIDSCYIDARAVAVDYKCAVWVGAQANRESLGKKRVTSADIAECFAIKNTADVMICLCQTDDEKDAGLLRFYMDKVRDAPSGMELAGSVNYLTKTVEMTSIVKGGSVTKHGKGDAPKQLDDGSGWDC